MAACLHLMLNGSAGDDQKDMIFNLSPKQKILKSHLNVCSKALLGKWGVSIKIL